MHINRGLAFWGVALITAGAVALAVQSSALTSDLIGQAWRLWPVALIVIGLSVIASRTPFGLATTILAAIVVGALAGSLIGGIPAGLSVGCGGEVDRSTAADGEFGDAAEVSLELNCGDLDVATGDGNAWRVEAGYAGDAEPTIDSDGSSLRVSGGDGGFIGFDDGRQDWQVMLPIDVTLDLQVEANAASSSLDLARADLAALEVDANAGDVQLLLGGAEIDALEVGANAGSVTILVDEATRLTGELGTNAGSIELCATGATGLAITLDDENVTFSHNLDDAGLTRSGDTWSSGSAQAGVTLAVEGNAASFTLNPDGGCE